MPIDKLENPKLTNVDSNSIAHMQRQICCFRCGETLTTLRRVRDETGKKIKPAKYICMECYKSD